MVADLFLRFYKVLQTIHHEHSTRGLVNSAHRPTLLRSLYTTGLFAQYFDLDELVQRSNSAERFGEGGKVRIYTIIILPVITDMDIRGLIILYAIFFIKEVYFILICFLNSY